MTLDIHGAERGEMFAREVDIYGSERLEALGEEHPRKGYGVAEDVEAEGWGGVHVVDGL